MVKLCKDLTGELHFAFQADDKAPKLSLTCGQRSGSFHVYPAEDFPTPPELKDAKHYTIDTMQLLRRAERVGYAANPKSDRPIAGCVSFLGNQMCCVDGYRMAVSESPDLVVETPFLLPLQAFRHWGTLFPAGTAELAVSKGLAEVTMPGVTLLSRLVEGEQLKPCNVFPTSYRERCTVHPKEYRRELGYLNEFVKGANRQPIRFCAGELSVETSDGTFSTRMEFEGTTTIAYGFHARYMLEALRSFADYECLHIETGSPISPIVLRADEENYALILPVRLMAERAAA